MDTAAGRRVLHSIWVTDYELLWRGHVVTVDTHFQDIGRGP